MTKSNEPRDLLEDAGYEFDWPWSGHIFEDKQIFNQSPGDFSEEFLKTMAQLGEDFFELRDIESGYDDEIGRSYVEFTVDGTPQRIDFTREEYEYKSAHDRTALGRLVADVNEILHDEHHDRSFVLAIVGDLSSLASASVRLVLLPDATLGQLLEVETEPAEETVEILNADTLQTYARTSAEPAADALDLTNLASKARTKLSDAIEAADVSGSSFVGDQPNPKLRERLRIRSRESTLETCRNSESFRPYEPLAEQNMLVWFDAEGEFFQPGRHADLTDVLLQMLAIDARVSDQWVDHRGWIVSVSWDDASVHVSQEEDRDEPSDWVELDTVLTAVHGVLRRAELPWEVVPLDSHDQSVLLAVVPESVAEALRAEPVFDTFDPSGPQSARELRPDEWSALGLE